MNSKLASIPNRLRPWVDARRKWKLSHLHVQMARELGLNPNKLGKIASHRQELWKAPLPDFITPYGQKIKSIRKSGNYLIPA